MEVGQQEKVLGLPERHIPESELIRRGIMLGESIYSLWCAANGKTDVAYLFLATSAALNFDLVLRGIGLGEQLDKWDRFTPGARRREKFLTPERKKMAVKIVENICQRTEKYGVKPFNFSISHLRIIPDEGPYSSATGGGRTGIITMETNDIRSDGDFKGALAHEYYHSISLRRLAPRRARERFGWDFPKLKKSLGWIEEGVAEKSTQITMGELGFRGTPHYEERVRIVNQMCHHIARGELAKQQGITLIEVDSVFSGPEIEVQKTEAFSLFEAALYGRGDLRPLFQAIQRHYREVGGVRKFFSLVDNIGNLERDIKKAEKAKKWAEYQRLAQERNEFVEQLTMFASGIKPRKRGVQLL